ncbi:hypothetical protein LDENG_00220210 [Lucifuga dentata]|nr:hypothetical protein LDENG_00220210 [Lucifuga dentata]
MNEERVNLPDSEQEEEDVYEVERIIDMRVEEGEVQYRVRWKNYCSDEDTWEPETHLEDCREVLLAFKKTLAEANAKKDAEAKKSAKLLPMKSDVFDADSESDSDKDRPNEPPVKKKKKKKIREEEDEPSSKEKKKKKKQSKWKEFRPLPAPETDEEEEQVPTPPSSPKEKNTESAKRLMDSEEENDEPVSKKHKKDKRKDRGKHKKEKGEVAKKNKQKKEQKIDTSEDEGTAPLEEDLSDGPSDSQIEDTAAMETLPKPVEKGQSEDKSKVTKGKSDGKLQGIKDVVSDKKSKKSETATIRDSSLQKLKNLTSKAKKDAAPHSSDSSDSSAANKKVKNKGQENTSAPPRVASSSSTSSSSSSSSITAASSTKGKEDELAKEEVVGPKDAKGSPNLFEKFLLNEAKAKDRAPRRQAVHQPATEKSSSKPAKATGKADKLTKSTKESPAQKPDTEKTERAKQSDVSRPGQSYGFTLDSDEREGGEFALRPRTGDDFRERRERTEETQRSSWDRRTPTDDRRKRREDSEPRVFMGCEDNMDSQDPLEDKGQATLSLGMDINLDWLSLDDFQKHLNGEDEIVSGPPLSPSELRDAVKSGEYMAVKLALNSKEEYNLDQEVNHIPNTVMYCNFYQSIYVAQTVLFLPTECNTYII